ncbi:hypothetical protein SAMN05444161_5393 [Rhizobiales bacterium GAS191]|nr:hypothetical protein SAMN05519104_5629 [Rhizobiales bacterium GAS188]SEE31002.1 hypothetical protein SAMN05444161_5393 [Rhizobiales bacterium GAS191]
MPMYQLIFTDSTGRITLAEDQERADDQAALSFGKSLLQSRRYVDEVEIWNGSSLVGKARRSTWADPVDDRSTLH